MKTVKFKKQSSGVYLTFEDKESDRSGKYVPLAVAERLLKACKDIAQAVKDPVEHSMGFDQPPEYATSEDHELARVLFETRAAISEAEKP